MAEALAEVMTEGAFIDGALIGISENRHVSRPPPYTTRPLSSSTLVLSDGFQKSLLAPH